MRQVASDLPEDVLLVCPGLVYRRDSVDRLHAAEPHQLDLWRMITKASMTSRDLLEMVGVIMQAALPGMEWKVEPRVHPYTLEGIEINALCKGEWVEVGECGLAHPEVIRENIPGVTGVFRFGPWHGVGPAADAAEGDSGYPAVEVF